MATRIPYNNGLYQGNYSPGATVGVSPTRVPFDNGLYPGPRQETPGSGSSAGAGGAGGADQATLSSYDQAINNTNSGLGRLDNQLNSGYSGIESSYQNAINQLLASRNTGEADYNTNKLKTGNEYVAGKNTVGAQAGSTLNSLRRLLGSRGAGGGSAYTISAPGEVARMATSQRSELGQKFGENMQGLDTQWNRFLTDYENQRSGAASQRDQARQGLEGQISSAKAGILQQLASLQAERAKAAGGNAVGAAQPYLDQANTLLDQASRYQVAPINYQTQAYTAPDLAKYTVNPNATPTYGGQAASNDYTSPYLAALLGKREQKTVGA